jgi:hypothetical protein
LSEADDLELPEANRVLVQVPVDALRLSTAALFQRRDATFDRQATVL